MTLPRETLMRQAAVAVLKAAGTFAGSNVFDTRLDALDEEAQFPAIWVVSSVQRDTSSRAGGVPCFQVVYSLQVGCGHVNAIDVLAVQNVDILAQQVREALLCDPVWLPKYFGQVDNIREKRVWGRGGKAARYVSVVEMTFTSVWQREIYTPNLTSVLDINGMPQAAPRAVITDLTSITETIKLPSGDIAFTGTLTVGT